MESLGKRADRAGNIITDYATGANLFGRPARCSTFFLPAIPYGSRRREVPIDFIIPLISPAFTGDNKDYLPEKYWR